MLIVNRPVDSNMSVRLAYADYERIHQTYMNTSRFSPEYPQIKAELDKAREAYLLAVETAHPTWICFAG